MPLTLRVREQIETMKTKSISLFLPFIVSALGGVFFGLLSCGGYAWHKTVFDIIFYATLILCSILRYRKLSTSKTKIKTLSILFVWVILIYSCYFVIQAAASTFYPDPPESLVDFWKRFLIGLEYGPC